MRPSLRLSAPVFNKLCKQKTSTPLLSRIRMSTGVASETAQKERAADMSTTTNAASAADRGIESKDYQTASSVTLNDKQKLVVGSVLDLFAGKPTKQKLGLWTDDATFNDPLTMAEGRKQFEAQWYGLAAAFSEIERQSCTVTSSGNPITMDLKTRYKVKGLGMEKIIESLVKIHTDSLGERITSVEDRWNGDIPEGAIAKAFRKLNAVTVPVFVSVPKNEQEEAAKK